MINWGNSRNNLAYLNCGAEYFVGGLKFMNSQKNLAEVVSMFCIIEFRNIL